MATRDPRIDAYIARSADFAQPILTHLRTLVHDACPGVEETVKWGHPSFVYNGMLCGMAAFKQHCSFSFWRGALVVKDAAAEEAMGQFGRIAAVSDLPPRKVLAGYVKAAMALNDAAVKPSRPKRGPRPPVSAPAELRAALAGNAKARATFERLSPSGRREYVEWITEAKTTSTRARRLATAVEWMAEGKQRNWKYMKPRPSRPVRGAPRA